MKSRGLLIALIISLGINLGTVGTLSYYTIKRANPRRFWKNWEKQYDETWQELQDSLEISSELVSDIRERNRTMSEKTMSMGKMRFPYRDSLIELLKQPELDTARLNYLLAREAEVNSTISSMLFINLFETKKMLPEEAQEEYIDFYDVSIKFSGQPWYITSRKKDFFKGPSKK